MNLDIATWSVHIAQEVWPVDAHYITSVLYHFSVTRQVQLCVWFQLELCITFRKWRQKVQTKYVGIQHPG